MITILMSCHSGDLKAHAYIHNGHWPFKCPICSRGFSKQTNLKNHLFLHTGKSNILNFSLSGFQCSLTVFKLRLQCFLGEIFSCFTLKN